MDISVPAEELRDAPILACRYEGLLIIDGAFADPQAAIYLRNDSVETVKKSAATTAGAPKIAHYARSGLVSFDASCYMLIKIGSDFIDQLATSAVRAEDKENIRKMGVVNEPLRHRSYVSRRRWQFPVE